MNRFSCLLIKRASINMKAGRRLVQMSHDASALCCSSFSDQSSQQMSSMRILGLGEGGNALDCGFNPLSRGFRVIKQTKEGAPLKSSGKRCCHYSEG